MSVSATHLTDGSSNVSATNFVSASITPSANQLLLAWVTSRDAAGLEPNVPTGSGCGLTWVLVNSVSFPGFGPKISLLRAMGGAPTPGAVTFDFGAQSNRACSWSIEIFSGVDTTGTNGSGAIVQSVAVNAPSSSFTAAATLAAFSDVNNATAGGFDQASNAASLTPGTGFTLLGSPITLTDVALMTEWRLDNATTVDASSSLSQGWDIIAVEIKAALASPPIIGSATPPLVWATRVRP